MMRVYRYYTSASIALFLGGTRCVRHVSDTWKCGSLSLFLPIRRRIKNDEKPPRYIGQTVELLSPGITYHWHYVYRKSSHTYHVRVRYIVSLAYLK